MQVWRKAFLLPVVFLLLFWPPKKVKK